MRSLLLKELHQGRSLLIFSALLGVLVPVGYVVLQHTPSYRIYAVDQPDLAVIFGKLILLLPFVVALFAGAGLFAGEADRGTLPVLLSLPFSRRTIWLAKALAGLALTALGAALIVGLNGVLLPQALVAFPVIAYLPDLALALVFAFSVALFVSTVSSSALAAVVAALLLGGLLALGAVAVWAGLGGPLLGYDPLLDLGLWGLVFTSALLCASAVVIGRCELLQSRRKHLLAFPLLAVLLVSTVLAVAGAARLATPYRRDRVETIWMMARTGNPSVVMFYTQADPVPFQRGEDGKGWARRPTRLESDEIGNSTRGPLYRSTYQVAIDIHTGQELFTLRQPSFADPQMSTLSPDGRYAAVVTLAGSITWGRPETGTMRESRLHIYDLLQGKRLFTGKPRAPGVQIEDFRWWPQWSSSARYLAFLATSRSPKGGVSESLWVMRPDGTGLRNLRVLPAGRFFRSWAWSPIEEVLYVCDTAGAVSRVPVDGREPRVIWSHEEWTPKEPGLKSTLVLGFEPSPDGRWLALSLSRAEPGDVELPVRTTSVYAIRTDGSEAHTIATLTPSDRWPTRVSNTRLAWIGGGDSLVVLASCAEEDSQLLRWRPGKSEAAQVGDPMPYRSALSAVPGAREALIYPVDGEATPFVLDDDDCARPVLTAKFARENRWAGLDDTGRLLTQSWVDDRPAIMATNLTSGASEQIYP